MVCGGIAPQALVDAWEGGIAGKLGWSALVGLCGLLAWVIEGTEAGRSSRHRAKVNRTIVELVVKKACPNKDCQQSSTPSKQTSSAAMGAFFALIDKPSREVSFHNWGWYYTSLQWIGFSALGLLAVLGTWAFISADILAARWISVGVLVGMLVLALRVRWVWARKTLALCKNQVQQIASKLPKSVSGVDCPEAACQLK